MLGWPIISIGPVELKFLIGIKSLGLKGSEERAVQFATFSIVFNMPKICTNVTYMIVVEDNAGNVTTTEEIGYKFQYHVIPEFTTIALVFAFAMSPAILLKKRRRKTYAGKFIKIPPPIILRYS